MPNIEHVIVLMLENRSCDHLFGFLDHCKPEFENFRTIDWENPWKCHESVKPTDNASGRFLESPDHSHEGVMYQLTGKKPEVPSYSSKTVVDNSGFVNNFEERADNNGHGANQGGQVMRCFRESEIPVLTTLAKEFAVCTRWFCSVPGETWPNRNYAIAGTSHEEVDIKVKFYRDETIFEQLGDAGRSWSIYHDGIAQARAFIKLSNPFDRYGFRKMPALFEDIKRGTLPNYSFVEPRHGFVLGNMLGSNSQHPGDNKKSDRDFYAGEELVRSIYMALLDNRELFERTLFVITYDEHGGFPDHVPPPETVPPVDGEEDDEWKFNFKLLGPRVPAIFISPWISRYSVDENPYDHTSIVATVRKLFAPELPPLTDRDAKAKTFERHVLETELEVSRYDMEDDQRMPELPPKDSAAAEAIKAVASDDAPVAPSDLNEMQQSLLQLQVMLNEELLEQESERDRISPDTREQLKTTKFEGDQLKMPQRGEIERYLEATEKLFDELEPRHVEVRDGEARRMSKPDETPVGAAAEAKFDPGQQPKEMRLIDNQGAALITSSSGKVELFARPDRHSIGEGFSADNLANVVSAFQRSGAEATEELIETYRAELEQ